MNKVVMGLIVLVSSALMGCSLVEPGHVGIRVNLYGSQRGVEDYPIVTGRVVYNPFTTQIYEFPTYMQQAVWTMSKDEGNPKDESVTFNSIEGAPLNVDVSIAYQIEAEKVPHIFVKFRQDAENITHNYLRNKVRDALNRHASEMKVTSIFGEGKSILLKNSVDDLREELGPEGFHIDNISFISKLRVDPQVEQSINATITASQKSVEAENKIKQSEAEAKQAEAVANGIAHARLINAKADAEANRLLTASLSPELLQYEALQKWDGKMPQVIGQGGAVPFISLPAVTK